MALVVPVLACAIDSKEIGATAGDTGGSETGGDDDGSDSGGSESDSVSMTGMTATTQGTDSGSDGETAEGSSDGVDTGDETGMVATTCAQAFTQGQCDAVSSEFESCGWFVVPTLVVGLDASCNDLDLDSGYCFQTSVEDGCLLPESTCPDGETIVYANPVGLEIGAVQIFAELPGELTSCGPGGSFMPCAFDGETYDPPECACGCPS